MKAREYVLGRFGVNHIIRPRLYCEKLSQAPMQNLIF